MKTEERTAARSMRSEGASIKQVATTLGVSLSSVSRWVRDIELDAAARARLLDRNPAHNGEIVRRANLERARVRRTAWQEDGRGRARQDDALHRTGCMLYWAEGAKSPKTLEFTNSDPAMVRVFVQFLVQRYGIEPAAIRLRASLYADHVPQQRQIELFWLTTAGLPTTSLRTSVVNRYPTSSKRKRRGRLPYGTCRIVLHRAAVVQSILGAIQEYGGFDRPEWLG